jgi:hypothetical protein
MMKDMINVKDMMNNPQNEIPASDITPLFPGLSGINPGLPGIPGLGQGLNTNIENALLNLWLQAGVQNQNLRNQYIQQLG